MITGIQKVNKKLIFNPQILTNMKKFLLMTGVAAALFIFSQCSSSKKTTASVPKTTYASNVSMVVMNNCTPCHIPAKGGNKKAYDNYASVKTDIDEIIRRISLN